ncbi:hypothetical protein ACOMHN_007688 [Nucella lapillus]
MRSSSKRVQRQSEGDQQGTLKYWRTQGQTRIWCYRVVTKMGLVLHGGSLLTTVLPPAQPSAGQHKPSSLPMVHHPEEETQLHEKQISITEKPTSLSSQRILENDRNTEDFHLAKFTYKSEEKHDKTLPEVTRPLLGGVAETLNPEESGHVTDELQGARPEKES